MEAAVNKLSENWLSLIKASGYRLTGPRYTVVDILTHTGKALTAQDIFEQARKRYPSLGLVSVYRTLEKLERLGLIQRVHQPEKCQAYIAAFAGHEHLLVCRACGKVDFFQGDDLSTLIEHVELQSGYHVHEHWLQLFGVCADCQQMGKDQ
jgi:Fe2+ or Zn2+ uptake regulation protein